jgi:peptidoglycan hydrolase-like protein with peptidoglycan-binding domain
MLPTIRHGDNSDTVKVAQLLMGYEPADGEYSADYVARVCSWQREHGCDPDGIIGPATWKALAAGAPTVSTKSHRYGEYAQAVQLLVGVEADGIYGNKTRDAVAAYQAAASLKPDGICGPLTWGALITGETGQRAPAGEFVQPPNFKQYDAKWANKMYSSHGDKSQTMRSSGCGPTAMADIVAEWWDKDATPWTLAQKSMDWGCRTYDSGTSSTFFRKCAQLYGASKYVTTSSIETAIQCLLSGGYVVVCFGKGTPGKSSYQKWTKGGHYCTLWKYADDTFYINDPASSSAKRARGTKAEVQDARKGFYCFWR